MRSMSHSIFNDKRTRSQLTLPDGLLLHLPQGSPLKDAKTALRKNLNMGKDSSVDLRVENASETDDELLLSPRKTAPTTKRSASPRRNEYASRSDSPSEMRELKRIKRDVEMVRNGEGSTHFRSLSQPESRTKVSHTRSATPPAPKDTDSLKSGPLSNVAPPSTGRARSVPVFPSSSSSNVMHIDLRNPPPSPRRPGSRSPSKERELRIVSGPTMFPRLDTIMDEANSQMNVDEGMEPAIPPLSPQLPILDPYIAPTGPADLTIPLENLESVSDIKKPLASDIYEPPSTPTTQQPTLSFSMSPLTPLSEISDPSSSVLSTEDKCTTVGWGADLVRDGKDQVSNLMQSPPKPLLGQNKSSFPRPSSTNNMSSFTKDPYPISSTSTPTVMKHPSTVNKYTSAGSSTTIAKKVGESNAFTVLMNQARENKDKGKGKSKEVGIPSKIGLSSTMKSVGRIGSPRNPTTKISDKGKFKEGGPSKMSLKAKMRPKAKPKPVPAPLITMHDSDTDDKEICVPSPRTPLLPDTLLPSHLTTPPLAGVSMEIFHPVPLDAMAPSEIPRTLEAQQKTNANTTISITSGDRADTNVNADHSIPRNNFATDSLLVIKPAAKKLHTSKRLPNAVPIVRVTRSASSRQNNRKPEDPKSFLKTTSGKQVSARKAISSMAPTTSESSSTSATKPIPAAQHDQETSTSSLTNISTDSIPNPVIPGSPMKVSSPVKKVTSVESSFARPTQSTTAKQLPSKSPVKLKLAKSATPSPNKLTRAASMYSTRPTGGLSRTFTSYPNTGGPSSLSTLANALEKLQMPPPGRPNTSMGFNRDVDSDDSFELRTNTKSDMTTNFSNLKNPKPGLTRTLLATGSIMRGTGNGFKVPGNVRRNGTRIFGVSGGAFSGATRARFIQKASRKTSLPSVMASPLKGAGSILTDDEEKGDAGEGPANINQDDSPPIIALDKASNEEGKGREKVNTWVTNVSRRASMASQALSQSLNALPSKETNASSTMGPPATPVRRVGTRSASSTYPSSMASTSSAGQAPEKVSPNTRSMTIGLKSAPGALEKIKGGVGGHVSSSKRVTSQLNHESLKILNGCVIFVDVRTDDGDEAGSLFVEMLEGVGARILTRVGQTCTHIVFKNGLMSTLTRYRLLRDPKPLVVGIAWVVECVEQRKQVDETKFLIDLDGMNVSGTNKRRRSMLPKLISRQTSSPNLESEDAEDDISIDGSASSMTLDDGLTPLEKARLRKGR